MSGTEAPGSSALIANETKKAEGIAAMVNKNLQGQGVRAYLEGSVVPVLMSGLQALCKERPEDPVQYLANYLQTHNPKNKPAPPAAASAAAAGASQ